MDTGKVACKNELRHPDLDNFLTFFFPSSPFNTKEILQRAKEIVDREYAVVGVLEDMEITLRVLENYIPRFFKGVHQIYHDDLDKFTSVNKNHEKPSVSEDIKEILRRNFTYEIEFYEFCRQRLHEQYQALNLN